MTGDLDIAGNLIIDGAGAGSTTRAGNTAAADSARDRVVHVISGTVTLRDLTIRDGRTSNQAAGAGLRTEPGTNTTLTNVVVGLNSADGNAGGILNRGTMVLNASAVTSNETRAAADGGGGIFNSGSLTINASRILQNLVTNTNNNVFALGGGIYSATGTTLRIFDSAIEQNEARFSGLLIVQGRSEGGGIWSEAATLEIRRSTISQNLAEASLVTGGGIFAQGDGEISQTLVLANLANSRDNDFVSAGGLHLVGIDLIDSVVEGNTAQGGGVGGGVEIRVGKIENTTLIGNRSLGGDGGGVWLQTAGELINSSVIGNSADRDGGGIFLSGSGSRQIRSTTVAGNTANADNNGSGVGGGIRIDAGVTVEVHTSVLAGNDTLANASGDDCFGAFSVGRHSWFSSVASCSFDSAGNVAAGAALLGTNGDAGGPLAGAAIATLPPRRTLVRLPLAGSPLVDAGDPGGCRRPGEQLLVTDQLGRPRVQDGPDPDSDARCDIGAVESGAEVILRNGFE